MYGSRYGRWAGLWLTTEEAVDAMHHITENGEQPVTVDGIAEGHILQDKMNQALTFEVFLFDHIRDMVFLTEI